jgi:hypothetical protein
MAAKVVHVPQQDGEIRITPGGKAPLAYEVVDHTVKVDVSDLDLFLSAVDGARESKEATAKPAATKDGNK